MHSNNQREGIYLEIQVILKGIQVEIFRVETKDLLPSA